MPEPQTPLQSVSPNVIGEPTTLFNALPRQVLEQELQFCNERSQQAQVLLRQAQEQLQLSQLVIQRQETLTQTLQSRIDQLERELQDVHTNCDELRDRLKRQQHHTSQLKAALERCLDTATPAPHDIALSSLESWSIAKLADEKITPMEVSNDSPMQNVVKIVPAPQPIELDPPQELKPFISKSPSPEVEEPLQLSRPARTQPISPLIVRPHKASHGSPIAPNLPPLQTVTEPKEQSMANWRIEKQPDPPHPDQQAIAAIGKNTTTDQSANPLISSSSAVTNSTMASTVAMPKFMQALYGNANSPVNKAREEDTQLAIANANPRKAVTSLAAVQLPQFPPLPRR